MGEIYIPVRERQQTQEDKKPWTDVHVLPTRPEVRHDNFAQRLLYGIGAFWHKRQYKHAEVQVSPSALEDWKVRRKALTPILGTVSVVASVSAVVGFSVYRDGSKEELKPPAPIVCEFSQESVVFLPKIGQGWRAGIHGLGQETPDGHKPQRVKGIANDSFCETQLVDHLYTQYAEPHYDKEYKLPAEVHRATTTTQPA